MKPLRHERMLNYRNAGQLVMLALQQTLSEHRGNVASIRASQLLRRLRRIRGSNTKKAENTSDLFLTVEILRSVRQVGEWKLERVEKTPRGWVFRYRRLAQLA